MEKCKAFKMDSFEKEQSGGTHFPISKLTYKAAVINTVWHSHQGCTCKKGLQKGHGKWN